NVTIDCRWADNHVDPLATLAADLVQHRVAAIVTLGPLSTLAAKSATSTVPIVFSVPIDPVQLGLVASVNRPGGNLTGVNVLSSEVATKGLEVLHELLPATTSVGFPENPANPVTKFTSSDVLAVARHRWQGQAEGALKEGRSLSALATRYRRNGRCTQGAETPGQTSRGAATRHSLDLSGGAAASTKAGRRDADARRDVSNR